jgi:hypothetical protein
VAKSFGSMGDPARIAPAAMAEQLSMLRQTSRHVEAAALVEEMVARTHERAAALYESWAQRRGEGGVEGLEDRAQAHRWRASHIPDTGPNKVRARNGGDHRCRKGVENSRPSSRTRPSSW